MRPLRILLCCQQDLRPHPIPAYQFWASYFRSALAQAGHTCLEAPGCDWAEGLTYLSSEERSLWRSKTWEQTLDWIGGENRNKPIDLFLSYLYPEQVSPEALGHLRNMGIPTVNFFCDNVRMFRKVPGEFHGFDLHWVPESAAVAMYRSEGLRLINAPMACWVPKRWRELPTEELLPPTFVGTRDIQRERLFAEGYQRGLKMNLVGPGWTGTPIPWITPPRSHGLTVLKNQFHFVRRQGIRAFFRRHIYKVLGTEEVHFDFSRYAAEAVSGDPYWRTLRGSRVCVGVNRFPSYRYPLDRPGRYSRLRDIEAPMAGSAYLTEWAPGLDELYEFGKEIEVYRTAEELVEKAARLDSDEKLRRSLRVNGQRRALNDHCIERSIERISELLGLS